MESDARTAATGADLREAIADLKVYLAEREVTMMRWFITTQLTYFGITLAAVWFMVAWLAKH